MIYSTKTNIYNIHMRINDKIILSLLFKIPNSYNDAFHPKFIKDILGKQLEPLMIHKIRNLCGHILFL